MTEYTGKKVTTIVRRDDFSASGLEMVWNGLADDLHFDRDNKLTEVELIVVGIEKED